jgi:GR25 family glycosyltransferase involved in LPS biosynthesis
VLGQQQQQQQQQDHNNQQLVLDGSSGCTTACHVVMLQSCLSLTD